MNTRALCLCLLLASVLGLVACGATKRTEPQLLMPDTGFRTQVQRQIPSDDEAAVSLIAVHDPLGPFNRWMYEFNAELDRFVLLPAVRVYRMAIPTPARNGVTNVLAHLNEGPTLVNCLLQGRLDKAGVTLGRILMNTTFGLCGLFDVAVGIGLNREIEDFGQTLGVWGFGPGPYLVLPAFGPSNVRDTGGLVVDRLMTYAELEAIFQVTNMPVPEGMRTIHTVASLVEARDREPFRYYQTGSPFEYEIIRFVTTKKRELDIER